MLPAVKWSVQSQEKNVWAKFMESEMFYSELEPDFSNFAINLLSNFDPTFSQSKSKSESDCNSMFMNLGICVFFILYLHSSK